MARLTTKLNTDSVEIVEPPIGELSKKQPSWFKRGCLTGVASLIIFFLIAYLGLRVFMGPGPKVLKAVPPNFPRDIPVYDQDAITRVVYISGRYTERGHLVAAWFPRLILSPLFLDLTAAERGDQNWLPMTGRLSADETAARGDGASGEAAKPDSLYIEWQNLVAEPSFIISYYKKELLKKNFRVESESTGLFEQQFFFARDDGTGGSLYARGRPLGQSGTEYALLTVHLGEF